MNEKDYIGPLQKNIEKSMEENEKITKWIKLLESVSLNIYKQCAKPKGRLGRLVATYAGVRPELCKWGLKLLKPDINGTFLEVGFGPGYLIYALARTIKDLGASGKVYGVDHSATMVYDALERNAEFLEKGLVKLECADVNQLPFPNELIDNCITVNSINFWSDVPQGLSEVYRVLKKDGRFLILETTFQQNIYPQRLIKARAGGAAIREKELFLHYLKEAGFVDGTLYLKSKWQFLAIIAKK